LSVALVHAVMMSIFIMDLTFRQRALIEKNTQQEALSISNILATSSALWLSSYDVVGLQEIVDNQLKFDNLEYVIITEKDGHILAHSDLTKKDKYLIDLPDQEQQEIRKYDHGILDISTPVVIGTDVIGWVRIGMNYTVAENILSDITLSGILYMLVAIIIGAITAYLMGRQITKRLYVISDTMLEIGHGNKNSRVEVTGKDEASMLANEFNMMLDKLAHFEKDLQNNNEQLIKKNQEYAELNEHYKIQNDELKQFAYISSHDLQEPLRTLIGHSEFLRYHNLDSFDESGKRSLGYLHSAATRMQNLIQALLMYSRIGRRSSIEHVDINEIIHTLQSDIKLQIEDSGAQLKYEELPSLVGYKTEIYQLFLNIITNAIKYSKPNEKPLIEIEGSRSNDFVTFNIRDNGIGIDEMYHKKIFEVFQRLHNNSEIEGSGIGLAFCVKIINLHHGEISVASTPGEGSCFTFTLKSLENEKTTERDLID